MILISPLNRLSVAALGLHGADQLAMAALPLTALLALGAGPGEVGMLLAAQAAAWLVFSLPAGLLVDRLSRAWLVAVATLAAAAGAAGAMAAAMGGWAVGLGLAAFLGSCGTVMFVLAAGSLVPGLAPREALPAANARLELARAAGSLAAPPLAGLLAAQGAPVAAYGVAFLTALLAFGAARRLPPGVAPKAAARPPIRDQLADGMRFVLGHALLRGIFGCALAWNFAFFALLAVLVPFALGPLGLDPAQLGVAQAGYGLGMLTGASIAARVQDGLGPNAVLIAGPGLSVAAPLLLLAAPVGGVVLPFAALFLVGFGPMMWLICQVSIRQIVTPPEMLGRVGAVLQVAIYGVRPLGALAGGTLAAAEGPAAGIGLAGVGFALSCLIVLASDLRRLRRLPPAVA
ncbi:MFS transporter [Roseomonas terrae]|jgi:predicted MFS family arabinose efflux permease|uniref:MFS transporter n=1 Tax=Neoroseomonas terrae TaxID=424799 RepID=A0ABS5EPQ4_9PROT|nr:MFS transporter [Neoroseomonas terrae]MBR0653020.1 MFS transporter [Neoroseomonas terrae]